MAGKNKRVKRKSRKRSVAALIEEQRQVLFGAYGICHTLTHALKEESGISYIHGETADVAAKIIDRVATSLELIAAGKDPSIDTKETF